MLKKRMAQEEASAALKNERLRADSREFRLASMPRMPPYRPGARLNDEHGQATAQAEAARQLELTHSTSRTAPRSTDCSGASPRSRRGAQRSGCRTNRGAAQANQGVATRSGARGSRRCSWGSERQAYEALTEQKEGDHRY